MVAPLSHIVFVLLFPSVVLGQVSKWKGLHFWTCDYEVPHMRCGMYGWLEDTKASLPQRHYLAFRPAGLIRKTKPFVGNQPATQIQMEANEQDDGKAQEVFLLLQNGARKNNSKRKTTVETMEETTETKIEEHHSISRPDNISDKTVPEDTQTHAKADHNHHGEVEGILQAREADADNQGIHIYIPIFWLTRVCKQVVSNVFVHHR